MIEVYETIGYLVLGFLSVMWLTKIAKCSLRDYFAAKAMEAFISGWIERNIYPPNDLVVAEHAYSMADAMLKAREA